MTRRPHLRRTRAASWQPSPPLFPIVAAVPPVAAADGVAAAAAPASRPAVRLVRVPDGGVFPQAQTDARGTIHLTYTTGDPAAADVYYARSADGGDTFSRPVRVNRGPGGAVVVGTVRGPQMAVGRDGRVHVAWMGSGRAAKAAAAAGTAAGKGPPAGAPRCGTPGRPTTAGRSSPSGTSPGAPGARRRRVRRRRPGRNVYVAWHAPASPGGGEADRRVWVARSRDGRQDVRPRGRGRPGGGRGWPAAA